MIELIESNVVYDDANHTYTLEGKKLSGVTSLLHRTLFSDMYNGIPEAVLNKAAERGSSIHSDISMYVNGGIEPVSVEGVNFITNILPLINPFRAEYLIDDGESFASSIDLLSENEDNSVDIIDIKSNKQGPVINYVTWQLSIYASLFEKRNKGVAVRNLYCLWLSDNNAKLIPCERIPSDIVDTLMFRDKMGLPFVVPFEKTDMIKLDEDDEICEWISFERKYIELTNRIKELDELKSKLITRISGIFNDNPEITTIESEHVRFSWVKPTTRNGFDSTKFKKDMPELYEKYKKVSPVKGYVKSELINCDED